jgi:hypothetical protein
LERVRILVLGAVAIKPIGVLFVCIPTLPLFGCSFDWLPVIASVDDTLYGLPIAAAVQSARVTTVPVIPDPPPVHAVGIRPMAMATLVFLICVSDVAVFKVTVLVEFVFPTRLVHDSAEPSFPTALWGGAKVSVLDPFVGTSSCKRSWTSTVGQLRRGRRVPEVRGFKVSPSCTCIVTAVLVWTFRHISTDFGRTEERKSSHHADG